MTQNNPILEQIHKQVCKYLHQGDIKNNRDLRKNLLLYLIEICPESTDCNEIYNKFKDDGLIDNNYSLNSICSFSGRSASLLPSIIKTTKEQNRTTYSFKEESFDVEEIKYITDLISNPDC